MKKLIPEVGDFLCGDQRIGEQWEDQIVEIAQTNNGLFLTVKYCDSEGEWHGTYGRGDCTKLKKSKKNILKAFYNQINNEHPKRNRKRH